MTTTANFEITHLSSSQTDKEITVNDGWDRIDSRMADSLVHNMTADADYVLDTSNPAYEHQHLLIRITDTNPFLSTTRTIQFPANKGFYIFHNLTAQDLNARVGASGGSVTCGAGTLNLIVSDGTDMLLGAGSGGTPGTGTVYDFSFFLGGLPASLAEVIRIPFTRSVTFPQNLPNSEGSAKVAATAAKTFTFKKNGSSFATMDFAAAASVATFTQASDTTFIAGDIFTVDSPSSDVSLSNVGVTLAVTRN